MRWRGFWSRVREGIPIPFLHRAPAAGSGAAEGGDPRFGEVPYGEPLRDSGVIRLAIRLSGTGRVTGDSEADAMAILDL